SSDVCSSDLAVRQRLEAGGAPVVAFRTTPAGAFHPNAARLSAVLGAPVVVSPEGENGIPADALLSAAPAYEAEGAMLLVAHGSEPDDVGRLRRVIEHAPAGALGLAWEVDPAADSRTARIAAVLRAAGPHLRHIRLLGGGPESAQHEGRGIGPLMARLALAGYDGPLALAPSTPRYHTAWSLWLGRGGGWGCGSKAADPSLVRLDRS